MRWVDRNKVPIPRSLNGSGSPAVRERMQAALHFQASHPKPFNFVVYKRKDIAEALNALFHGKCAYCESNINAIQPTDIEHFRPKGSVANCPGHPGYWWLAASWHNLLPSCIDCNRQRYHNAQQLAHDPLEEEVDGRFLLGKGDLFPILGGTYAIKENDDYEAEDAALINPTQRNPSNHLIWLERQNFSLVGPKEKSGKFDLYGSHTHKVFGLNRQGLVDLRTSKLRDIKTQLVFIEDLFKEAISNKTQEKLATILCEQALKQLEALYRYAEPDQPYSVMAEELLNSESERLLKNYESLIK